MGSLAAPGPGPSGVPATAATVSLRHLLPSSPHPNCLHLLWSSLTSLFTQEHMLLCVKYSFPVSSSPYGLPIMLSFKPTGLFAFSTHSCPLETITKSTDWQNQALTPEFSLSLSPQWLFQDFAVFLDFSTPQHFLLSQHVALPFSEGKSKLVLMTIILPCQASQVVLVGKNMPANAGHIRDVTWTPGLEISPEGRYCNPLQYSGLEDPH